MSKGGKRQNAGRPKGTPNRTTKEVRQLFENLLSANIDNLQILLDKVAEENPTKAIELILKMSEFVLPKPKPTSKEQEYKKPRPMFGDLSLTD